MNRRSTPGIGQWLLVTILMILGLYIFYQAYQYSFQRALLPAGLTIGGVGVGGMNEEQATQLLTERYLLAPVKLIHPNGELTFNPNDAGMELDFEVMLSQAENERIRQDFWQGLLGYITNNPVNVNRVELRATHDQTRLRRALQIIADQLDEEVQPPQPAPASLSFQFGEPGVKTDIDATIRNVESALYRVSGRDAQMVAVPVEPARPDMLLLGRLLVNHVQSFSDITSIFIMDLESGQEITYRADVAMSGMDMLKTPIALNAMRVIDASPTLSQTELIANSLLLQEPGNDAANQLLNMIAGKNDPYLGAQLVTESMQRLGLTNTYILAAYNAALPPGQAQLETPANSREDIAFSATSGIQTTAEDMGAMMAGLYYCARDGSGALPLLFEEEVTPEECQMILDIMAQNRIGSLIEGGAPPETRIAHRHAWVNDTHADAGIVYSPNGDYVIVVFMHRPDWLEWEISSPMIADISRATYNYFNFADPYLAGATSN